MSDLQHTPYQHSVSETALRDKQPLKASAHLLPSYFPHQAVACERDLNGQ